MKKLLSAIGLCALGLSSHLHAQSINDCLLENYSQAEYNSLTKLTCNNITSLDGITKVTGLKNLQLFVVPELSDVSKLSDLKQLTHLSIYLDVTDVEHNYNVRGLIQDIQFVTQLTELQELTVNTQSISDIPTLETLTKLETINLGYNLIEDVAPLTSSTSLRSVSLYNNKITDLSALSGWFGQNISMSIFGNPGFVCTGSFWNFDSVNAVCLEPNTSDIDQDGASDRDEKYLGFDELDSTNHPDFINYDLLVDSNLKQCIQQSGAKYIQTNERIICTYSDIQNIEGIEQFTHLRWLELSANKISDLSPLVSLAKASTESTSYSSMWGVSFAYNNISNLDVLNDWEVLEYLNLSSNDYSPTIRSWLNGNPLACDWQADVHFCFDIPDTDTDEDGYIDATEIYAGSDPNDKSSTPIKIADLVLADENLLSCVQQFALNKNLIYVYQINEVNCAGKNIESLEGIEQFTYITSVSLADNNIVDVSPLARTEPYVGVSLGINPLDVSTLSGISIANGWLDLSNIGLKDVETLPWLEFFYGGSLILSDNQISNAVSLTNFIINNQNISYWGLQNNRISDISYLQNVGANSYLSLDLSGNPITCDANAEYLAFSNYDNPFNDLDYSCLLPTDTDGDGLSDSEEVYYGLNPIIADASNDNDQDGYSNIYEIQVGSDFNDASEYPLLITDLIAENDFDPALEKCILTSQVQYVHELTFLGCYEQWNSETSEYEIVSSLSGIDKLFNLEEFVVTLNSGVDLTPLTSVAKLIGLSLTKSFSANETFQLDFSPISMLTKLEWISLTSLDLDDDDLSFLVNLANNPDFVGFDWLELSYNNLTDISALDLPKIRQAEWLSLDENPELSCVRRKGDYWEDNYNTDLCFMSGTLDTDQDGVIDRTELFYRTSINDASDKPLKFSEIVFNDEVFKECVANKFGYNGEEDGYVANLTELNCEYYGDQDNRISDLTGLEHFTSLQSLNLRYSAISDTLKISELMLIQPQQARLNELNLYETQVKDLSSLAQFKAINPDMMIKLDATPASICYYPNEGYNPDPDDVFYQDNYEYSLLSSVPDVCFISPLVDTDQDGVNDRDETLFTGDITNADITPAKIADIQFADDALKQCVLNAADDSSYSGLVFEYVQQLESLSCYDAVSSLSGIEQLTSLSDLTLKINQVADLSNLVSLPLLTSLHLTGDQTTVVDFAFLAQMPELIALYIYDFPSMSTKLSQLAILTNLRVLAVGNSDITDASELSTLVNLSGLLLPDNNLSDISFVENLLGLRSLTITNNQVSELSFITKLPDLRYLLVDGNQLTDIGWVLNLSLKGISAENNPLPNGCDLPFTSRSRFFYNGRYNMIPEQCSLLDSDSDGMPDWYEDRHGLAKLDAADATLDKDQDGFSNVEEFIANTDSSDGTQFPVCPIGTTEITSVTSLDKPLCRLSGTYTQDLHLTSDKYYLLDGAVIIGVAEQTTTVLTIDPGTTLFAENYSLLDVSAGSKIWAKGTRSNPIFFALAREKITEYKDDYQTYNRWSGVTIIGQENIEDDNSGALEFVIFDKAGTNTTLQLVNVGSDTNISHVHFHRTPGSAIGLFGGSVSVKNIVITSRANYAFNWSGGWVGTANNVLINTTESNGYAVAGFNLEPTDTPILSNFTILSNPNNSNDTGRGIKLFSSSTAKLYNFIISGEASLSDCFAFDLYAHGAVVAAQNGNTTITNSVIGCSNEQRFGQTNIGEQTQEQWFLSQSNNIVKDTISEQLNGHMPIEGSDIANHPAIDVSTISDKFTESVDYIGAFKAGEDWTCGWAQNVSYCPEYADTDGDGVVDALDEDDDNDGYADGDDAYPLDPHAYTDIKHSLTIEVIGGGEVEVDYYQQLDANGNPVDGRGSSCEDGYCFTLGTSYLFQFEWLYGTVIKSTNFDSCVLDEDGENAMDCIFTFDEDKTLQIETEVLPQFNLSVLHSGEAAGLVVRAYSSNEVVCWFDGSQSTSGNGTGDTSGSIAARASNFTEICQTSVYSGDAIYLEVLLIKEGNENIELSINNLPCMLFDYGYARGYVCEAHVGGDLSFEIEVFESQDFDGDGIVDILDADDDNDGVDDIYDRFPKNAAASLDFDFDGLADSFHETCDSACILASGLMLDNDDDNDGVEDALDYCPYDYACSQDDRVTLSVYPSRDAFGANVSENFVVDVMYDAQEHISSFGVRVFFDSSVLQFNQLLQTAEGDLGSFSYEVEDIDDLDNDPATNVYIEGAWFDLGGLWPAKLGKTKLFSLEYQLLQELSDVGESINIVEFDAAIPPGYKFANTSISIRMAKDLFSLDINGDGKVSLPSDGFIILRHMVGFPAEALATEADLVNATRTKAEMKAMLDSAKQSGLLDINGDGETRLPSDGFIILRHMVGFPAVALATDNDLVGATRNKEQMKAYLDGVSN